MFTSEASGAAGQVFLELEAADLRLVGWRPSLRVLRVVFNTR